METADYFVSEMISDKAFSFVHCIWKLMFNVFSIMIDMLMASPKCITNNSGEDIRYHTQGDKRGVCLSNL